MSALTSYQAGGTFPAISTAMLAKVAGGLNPTYTAKLGGPPPTPNVLEAIVDAITALDTVVNG